MWSSKLTQTWTWTEFLEKVKNDLKSLKLIFTIQLTLTSKIRPKRLIIVAKSTDKQI